MPLLRSTYYGLFSCANTTFYFFNKPSIYYRGLKIRVKSLLVNTAFGEFFSLPRGEGKKK